MEYIRGSRILGDNQKYRRPMTVIEDERVCASEECVTRLSRYNTHDSLCFSHAPKKKPRIRGRKS